MNTNVSEASDFKKLFRICLPHKGLLILGVFCSVLGALAELIIPQMIGRIVDVKTMHYILDNKLIMLGGAAFFLIIYLIQGIAIYLLGRVGADAMNRLQTEFTNYTFSLPLSQIDHQSAGDLASRLTNDISEVTKIVTVLFPQLTINLIIVCGSVLMLLKINFKLTLISLLIIPICFIIIAPINNRLEKLYNAHQTYLGNISGEFTQKIRNVKIIKAFLGHKQEESNFRIRFNALANNLVQIVKVLAALNTFMSALMMLFVIVILLSASLSVTQGLMTFSALITFILYIVQMVNPMIDIINNLSELSETKGALHRITYIMSLPNEDLNQGDSNFRIHDGGICFNHVTFGYELEKQVLNDVSISIAPKQFVAIVGPSGAGKTTILSLLMKFYTGYTGSIEIDGISLSKISPFALRNQCAFVLQSNSLFSGTIRDNLLYGKNSNASETEIEAALELSGANTFVNQFPQGINTKIGEDGIGLSEGQRQRLNISRAFLRHPKIILLDEITANLDAVAEEEVIDAIKAISKTATTIMVAHRLKTILRADIIFVMEKDGTIKFSGTHDELLQKSPTYQKIYEDSKI